MVDDPPGAGPSPQQTVEDAMWSVYFHSAFRNGLRGPALSPELGLEPMPLRNAANLLADADDHHAQARRGLALRKIVAAGLDRRDRLIGPLGEELGAETRGAIERLAGRLGISLDDLDDLPMLEALLRLIELLRQHPLLPPGCEIADSACTACHDGITLKTTVRGSVRVNRDLEHLMRSTDPRAWSACSPYFQETRRVENAPGYPTHPKNGAPYGTPWTGLLFERVKSGPVIFENVLRIDAFERTSARILLEYDEHHSVRTHFPFKTIEGGIEIDCGKTIIEPDGGGWSRVQIEKTVRFVDLTPGPGPDIDYGELLNYWTPAILCLWVDEDVDVSPCCKP